MNQHNEDAWATNLKSSWIANNLTPGKIAAQEKENNEDFRKHMTEFWNKTSELFQHQVPLEDFLKRK